MVCSSKRSCINTLGWFSNTVFLGGWLLPIVRWWSPLLYAGTCFDKNKFTLEVGISKTSPMVLTIGSKAFLSSQRHFKAVDNFCKHIIISRWFKNWRRHFIWRILLHLAHSFMRSRIETIRWFEPLFNEINAFDEYSWQRWNACKKYGIKSVVRLELYPEIYRRCSTGLKVQFLIPMSGNIESLVDGCNDLKPISGPITSPSRGIGELSVLR